MCHPLHYANSVFSTVNWAHPDDTTTQARENGWWVYNYKVYM